ncbi:MAG TPA: sigma factor-like helix-turn-helix DNA-binding protein [Bryobacteraceae bacterium]|nr:sigma factor-like helix-turn-helix DNA-binding protein [Bryobacteraceae bacterium]
MKVQVFSDKDKFAFECDPEEAVQYVSRGLAVRVYESKPSDGGPRVFHLRLVKTLNSPNWIFGAPTIRSERMSNGLQVHTPKRAASYLRVPERPASEWIADAFEGVGEEVDHAQLCLAMDDERFVRDMSSKRAACLVLSVIWGYTCEEISRLLGVPLQTVHQNIKLGLKSLRKLFSEKNQGDMEKTA